MVVLDDADLAATVPALLGASFFNAGQSCTAATRVIATPGIHDALVDALAAHAAGIEVGPDGYYGALNNPDQLARVVGLRRAAPRARLGGDRRAGRPRPRLLLRAHGGGRLPRG